MSIKENLLYTAEDSSLQESSALGSRAPLSLMRGWAVTAWPAEPLIPETSPSELTELPPDDRAPQVPAVPTCRWAGVEGNAGGASLGQGRGWQCFGHGAGTVGLLDPGDRVHSTWAVMLCWMSEVQGKDLPLGV